MAVSPFISSSLLIRSPTYLPFKHALPPHGSSLESKQKNVIVACIVTCSSRRTANYKPNMWNYESMILLKSDYMEDKYKNHAEDLKASVRHSFEDESIECFSKLELVDAIQRLGVGYHFEREIKRTIEDVFISVNNDQFLGDNDLYATALQFRLLRQHGNDVSADVFNRFKDEAGNFRGNVKGLLYLYEASYLGFKGENILDEAKRYTTEYLKTYVKETDTNTTTLAVKITHSLEVPLHWRYQRVETRWNIDIYDGEENMNPFLLELSRLDFNIVQAVHQSELVNLTRWWMGLDIHNLDFSRDRLVEHFFWSLGLMSEPQYGWCRNQITKLIVMVTLIDDIYDVYGSLEELKLFTEALERWDINAINQLPDYMKICYMTLLNTSNDISEEILDKRGFDTKSHQKKLWIDLCKAYMVEAEWFHKGYTPTLEEYLNNAVTSMAAPISIINAYILTAEKITEETIQYLEKLPSIIHSPSLICRLANDLGNSSVELKRGDVPKSIQCYMHQAGVSEEVAREQIKQLISETWKKLNKDLFVHYPNFQFFVVNAPRTTQHVYKYGDGHGSPKLLLDNLMSLLVEPIPLKTTINV